MPTYAHIQTVYVSGDDLVLSSMFNSTEAGEVSPELSCFLNRCFITRVRCLLDSTSGFLVSGPIQLRKRQFKMAVAGY